ncbi:hypothetical protein O204_01915 [Pseudomonas simiae]|uniref:Uncharacterized protein n=1 Tax=Pseudomonas simiae TaxID=321846 RepID=U1TSU1_9PSED|nr:hypothetical protein O204_01915 [Pseudomonas simiae]
MNDGHGQPCSAPTAMKMSGEIEQIIQLHTGETPDRN